MPPEPAPSPIGPMGWVRGLLRAAAIIVVIVPSLLLTVLGHYLVERPFFRPQRPFTPYLTILVCRSALVVMGLRYIRRGARMAARGAVVANHSSWLDIFALNAGKRIYFVSKSEVAGWPGIGILARATGTVFINRDRREARQQQEIFQQRLLAGHKLLFFPEGTSTDGSVVLPFKTTLFEAFFADGLRHEMHIQPCTVIYHPPESEDRQFYGWWGDMAFGPHLLKVLAAPKQGAVEVVYHQPVRVDDFPNRKSLAAHVEDVVRSAMPPNRR
ncbi:1-acyl-sn-glycerol-3-phosphate acyltransferase [Lutimaribacter sp. EGI FJ00013]|uniref:1-acyl-sn-glycerol-3-phosphate acyltransferase n=2 Tax=Lutimaribacter degradans TaxID=2945989 RepID=A0ACC5ZVM9_9RHOB|nr:lysophospholipid acyltransferase family protein [Lutimaribacter sp. EGI FJ00013]MCM2562243.1 1-acyl-sn-glycerol-3-phosphate acyltransferase [Lutimaribacter sp. EGI FJ00013]